jgi:hypothetical protein
MKSKVSTLERIRRGDILERMLWTSLQLYIGRNFPVRSLEKPERGTAVRDAIRYFTDDGQVIDLLWLRANTHEPESHTPDFIISLDSQNVVVIEAKNWEQSPNTTRTKLYILTRYESYPAVPCKLLLITASIPTHVQPLLTQEHINPIMVPPQVLSPKRGDLARIQQALWAELP